MFSLKKGGNADVCSNIDESWRHSKGNKLETKGQILYNPTNRRYLKLLKIIKTKLSNGGDQGLGWGVNGDLLFKGYRVAVWGDDNIQEMDNVVDA